MNKHKLFIPLDLCIFCLIILSKRSSAAHSQYEACLPEKNCGKGPNISFPFHLKGLQESYCGYPGFELNCIDEFPVLHLPENDYVVDDIFYEKRAFRVYNAALLRLVDDGCVPRLRNTSLDGSLFDYVDETRIRLFYNCSNLIDDLLPYLRGGCGGGSGNGSLVLYERNVNLGNAMEECEESVVVPVERGGDEDSIGISNVFEVMKRGFELNWTASKCSECRESGGRCGFIESSYHFRCFCPDRPHARSCKPGNGKMFLLFF